jgi:3-isopropylmalate dehydrogenase
MSTSQQKTVCVLPDDGIGPEVMEPALALLDDAARAAGLHIVTRRGAIGGEALDKFGIPLDEDTLEM